MSFVQCLLVSVFCIVSGNEFPLYGSQFGWYVLGRPLIGGFVCGIILGDVAAGIQLGVAVQLVYLALVTPGGSVPVDISFVSYPAMAIALAAKWIAEQQWHWHLLLVFSVPLFCSSI